MLSWQLGCKVPERGRKVKEKCYKRFVFHFNKNLKVEDLKAKNPEENVFL